jgi:hypothetical protein
MVEPSARVHHYKDRCNRSHPGEPGNLRLFLVMHIARTFERDEFQEIGQMSKIKIPEAAKTSGILTVRHFPTPCMPDP